MAQERLVGVFRTEAAARRAIEAAKAAGVPDSAISVESRADNVRALEGEMREEMEHTWVGPGNVGPFTKEMSKGMAVWVPVLTIVGALIGLPFAGWIGAICGAVAGATVGFLVGQFRGKAWTPDTHEDDGGQTDTLAAERGVTVGIDVGPGQADSVREVLSRCDPIRLDVAGPRDTPVGTVTTEEQQ